MYKHSTGRRYGLQIMEFQGIVDNFGVVDSILKSMAQLLKSIILFRVWNRPGKNEGFQKYWKENSED